MNLFDFIPKTLADAEDERDKAMARAESGANELWKIAMQETLVRVARAMKFFSSDDVFDAFAASGRTETTRDRRAFGPVVVQAAKNGVCRNTGNFAKSRRRHAAPLSIWESLIYGGGHESL